MKSPFFHYLYAPDVRTKAIYMRHTAAQTCDTPKRRHQKTTTMEQTTIRAATAEDAPIIASAIIMAIGEETALKYCGADNRDIFEQLAREELSQYSHRNALIAEVGGRAAGAIVGYDGARLQELRAHTFDAMSKHGITPTLCDDETGPGEFYIDSLGTLPEFRGRGIGRLLLESLRDKALREGHSHVGLIVDTDNHEAERLYLRLGFRQAGIKHFLGHTMHHLQYTQQ